jgi:hypothetical protein
MTTLITRRKRDELKRRDEVEAHRRLRDKSGDFARKRALMGLGPTMSTPEARQRSDYLNKKIRAATGLN